MQVAPRFFLIEGIICPSLFDVEVNLKLRFSLLILLVLVLLSTGCSTGGDATPTPTAATSVQEVEGSPYPYPYPAPVVQANPYPEGQDTEPVKSVATPLSTVTLAPGTGIVTGVVFLNGEPVAHYTFYLAGVITNDEGTEAVAALKRLSSPRTASDENGRFEFRNVPPGKYGLVLDTVKSAYMLHDPTSNEQIFVVVEADQQVDLGTLDFETLPIP